jgi:hypothetical protein
LKSWIVTKGLKKNLESIPGKHSIYSLQKTAILATSHIISKVLKSETWSLSSGDHRWFKRSTRKKRPVTRDKTNNTLIIIKKEAKKVLKYKDLKKEIQCMWNVQPLTYHMAHAHSEMDHFKITFQIQRYWFLWRLHILEIWTLYITHTDIKKKFRKQWPGCSRK